MYTLLHFDELLKKFTIFVAYQPIKYSSTSCWRWFHCQFHSNHNFLIRGTIPPHDLQNMYTKVIFTDHKIINVTAYNKLFQKLSMKCWIKSLFWLNFFRSRVQIFCKSHWKAPASIYSCFCCPSLWNVDLYNFSENTFLVQSFASDRNLSFLLLWIILVLP